MFILYIDDDEEGPTFMQYDRAAHRGLVEAFPLSASVIDVDEEVWEDYKKAAEKLLRAEDALMNARRVPIEDLPQ